jgi:hypothetical protein
VNRGGSGDSSAKDELLKWVQSKIPEYHITNFNKNWNDGKALNALTSKFAYHKRWYTIPNFAYF